jgi:hypothetical protein
MFCSIALSINIEKRILSTCFPASTNDLISIEDGYTSNEVVYEWEEGEVEISGSGLIRYVWTEPEIEMSEAAKSHLRNDGWEIAGTQKKTDHIKISTGKYI